MSAKTSLDGKDTNYLQYLTVYDNRLVEFMLESINPIDTSLEHMLRGIVDSATFGANPTDVGLVDSTNFRFYDHRQETSFLLPLNWVQIPVLDRADFCNFCFIPDGGDRSINIQYGVADLFAVLDYQNVGLSRSEINNSFFTQEEVGTILGISISSMATYGNHEYFVSNTNTKTRMVFIDNGLAYIISYTGTAENNYWDAFEFILNSMDYGGSLY